MPWTSGVNEITGKLLRPRYVDVLIGFKRRNNGDNYAVQGFGSERHNLVPPMVGLQLI